MSGRWIQDWALIAMFGIALPATAQQEIRLAVVAEGSAAAAPGDLLTVELSHLDGINLLERAQINKVLGEQALSSAGARDYLKLGEILGADGLVILEPAKKDGRTVLSSRLVAVKPGAVLWMADYPLPLADPGPWSKLVARQLQPLFPKLGVLQRDAVPISLLNLRSAVRSAQTESLEREMNLLLLSRLVREKEVFVLERRNLEALAGEKDFKGLVESPFWNGSYVLDGTIDKNGYNQETVTLSARLSAPGKAPMEIEVQGRRAELPQVINDLVLKLLATLSKQSGNPDWKPAEEAEQYYDEAGWALKWGMLKEAQAAGDASWALGKRTREVAERRIRIYNTEADPVWPDWAFMAATPQNSAPDIAKLAPATTALQLYEEAFNMFLAADAKPDMTWYGLGLTLLSADSELLDQAYYFGQESTQEHSGEWAEFRSLVRRTADMIGRHAVYGKLTKAGNPFFVKTRNERSAHIWFENLDLAGVKAAVGALWLETPEECLEQHREFVRTGELDRVFTYFPYQKLIAWNPRDRQRIPELWHGFIQELCESTNPLTKVEGHYLDFADAGSDQDYLDRGIRFLKETAENAQAIVTANRQSRCFKDIEDLLADFPGGQRGPRASAEMHAYYYSTFKSEFAANASGANAGRSNATVIAAAAPRNTFTPPTAAAGRGRLPPVELRGAATNILRVARFWKMPADWIFGQREVTPVIHIAGSRFREGRFWLEVFNGENRLTLRKASIYGVDLDNFKTEIIDLPIKKEVLDLPDRQEELFSTGDSFEVLGEYVYLNGPSGIKRYSLRTKAWEPVALPGSGSLTAFDGRLFAITADSILEMDKDGKGSKVLASTRRRPAVNRLDELGNFVNIFPGPNGVLRTLIGNKVFTQSPDGSEWSETTSLPESKALIGSTIFESGLLSRWTDPEQPTQWLGLANDQPSFETLLLESGAFHQSAARRPTWRPGVPLMAGISAKARWKHPRDIGLENAAVAVDGGNLWFFAGSLNLETNEAGRVVLQEEAGRHALLLEFKKDLPEACIVPLRLDLEAGVISPEFLNSLQGARVYNTQGMKIVRQLGGTVFAPMPQGIVVGAINLPGFWLIPQKEIEPRIEAIASEQAAERQAGAQAREQQWTELLNRHQIDHKGNLTPEEKEAMIDDPQFLELEMTSIDVNENGLIDAGEVAFFDANGNGILEPQELAGLEKAWGLLAARVMKDFDANGDGVLEASELPRPGMPDTRSNFVFPPPTVNYLQPRALTGAEGKALTMANLQELQRRLTEYSLTEARGWATGAPALPARGTNAGTGIKFLAEAYWRERKTAAVSTPSGSVNAGK